MNVYKSSSVRSAFLLLTAFGCFSVSASNLETVKPLSLSDYLELVRSNDPVFKQLEISKQQIDFLVDAGIEGNEYQFDAESQYGYGDDDVDTKSLSAKLSKEILDTGTHFSISHNSAENPDRNEKLSELQVEQDLLKNAFGKEQELKKNILTKTQQLERLEALEIYEDYLANKINLYLDFSQAAMEVDLSYSLLNAAKNLYQYVEEKYKKNAANSTDIKRARLQVLLIEEELLANKEKFDSAKQEILLSFNLVQDTLHPEVDLNLMALYPQADRVFNVQQFREYQMLSLKQEIIDDEYRVAKDADLAELSLLGGYKLDDSTRFNNSVNRKESSVGLRLSVPFKNAKASAQKKIKALDVKYGELDQLSTSQRLQSRSQALNLTLEKLKKQYAFSNEKLELMQSILKEENLRYERGRIDIDKIIEANNNYALYQFEKSNNLLALNKSYLEWLVLNDLLVSNQ